MEIKRDLKVGRYIISDKSYKKGDEITISECIPLVGNHMPRFSTGSPLWQYVFQGLEPSIQLVSLDWTSLMNHSEDANVDYKPISNTQIKFWAAKDINPGDELTINYGYDPLQHHQEVHSNMDDWNAMTAGENFHDAMGAMAPSMSGNEIASMVNEPNFTVLSKLRKKLEGAPRTTKEAFNTVLSYFENKGKCPATGCIEQDKEGNWRIISNKTGEYWPQKYDSEDSAKAALAAYHTSRKSFSNDPQYAVCKMVDRNYYFGTEVPKGTKVDDIIEKAVRTNHDKCRVIQLESNLVTARSIASQKNDGFSRDKK